MQAVLQRKEEEDRQTKQLVHTLQAALEREKATVHSLKEQVCDQLPTGSKLQLQSLSECSFSKN